jgi:hypothetical protein
VTNNISLCDCETFRARWGIFEDNSGGYFCPYIPKMLSVTTTCKKTVKMLGENIGPNIIKR